jgi:hypothetical protein
MLPNGMNREIEMSYRDHVFKDIGALWGDEPHYVWELQEGGHFKMS